MNTQKKPISVMVIDDSAVVRQILSSHISLDQHIKVVGVATDPFDARDKIVKLKPDVVTLDIEMPKMDGLTFLRKLMKFYPIPVIIVSTLSQKGSPKAYEAMSCGAVDVVGKPSNTNQLKNLALELQEKIKAAASANLSKYLTSTPENIPYVKTKTILNHNPVKSFQTLTNQPIIAVGSSTGGTQALRHLLAEFPMDFPPVLIVQHMPLAFTESFTKSLNRISNMEVVHASDGDILENGKVFVAPGDQHMLLHPKGRGYEVCLKGGPNVNRHKPSVDVLFKSVAQHSRNNAIGIILTGMGGDGAQGLMEMRRNGSRTIGENESSCVVYGMPREAYELGAVEVQLPLNLISQRLKSWLKKPLQQTA